jgi:hypothetical protein
MNRRAAARLLLGRGCAFLYEKMKAAEKEEWTSGERLRAALRGRRETGAQMLEVVVWGTMMTMQPVKCCSVSLLRSSSSVD